MQNYNQQQQAIILKGIANQILSMNLPSFIVVDKLFNEFGKSITNKDQLDNNSAALISMQLLIQDVIETLIGNEERHIAQWIDERYKEDLEIYNMKTVIVQD